MIRNMERENWKTTKDLRSLNPLRELVIFPFSTKAGLKEDNTNAGYKPEKKTPATRKAMKSQPRLLTKRLERENPAVKKRLRKGCSEYTRTSAMQRPRILRLSASARNCLI